MAAKISFMRLTLLSVLCNPSLVSFLILLIKIVYHTKRLKGMKINVDEMKMGHLINCKILSNYRSNDTSKI